MKVNVIFHSIYGHVWKMAEAIAEGARSVEGAQVKLLQVKETLSEDTLAKMGAVEAKKQFAHLPVAKVSDLAEADALIFGTPTRFGNMTAQMRALMDATGKLWVEGTLIGKPATVFTSTATQHGGQESTILSFHITLLHHGMVIVGMPYSMQKQMIMTEIIGGSPYGAGTIAGTEGERTPNEHELEMARFQGRHVAEIAKKLAG